MFDLLTLNLVFWGFIAFSVSGFIFIMLRDDGIRAIWRKMINLDHVLAHQHEFFSILTEIVSIMFMILSFFFPWYRIAPVWFGGITIDQSYYYFDMLNRHLLIWMFYYAYMSVILTLLVLINYKVMTTQIRFELAECLFLFPCMIVLINIERPRTIFLTGFIFFRYSGFSIGYYFFLLGFILLVINGVQLSIYGRKNRN